MQVRCTCACEPAWRCTVRQGRVLPTVPARLPFLMCAQVTVDITPGGRGDSVVDGASVDCVALLLGVHHSVHACCVPSEGCPWQSAPCTPLLPVLPPVCAPPPRRLCHAVRGAHDACAVLCAGAGHARLRRGGGALCAGQPCGFGGGGGPHPLWATAAPPTSPCAVIPRRSLGGWRTLLWPLLADPAASCAPPYGGMGHSGATGQWRGGVGLPRPLMSRSATCRAPLTPCTRTRVLLRAAPEQQPHRGGRDRRARAGCTVAVVVVVVAVVVVVVGLVVCVAGAPVARMRGVRAVGSRPWGRGREGAAGAGVARGQRTEPFARIRCSVHDAACSPGSR